MLVVLSYVFGVFGVIINFTLYRQKNRKNLLGAKLISDIIWGIHYILIPAYNGAITCGISTVREIVFLNKKHNWAKSKLWLVFFILCNTVSIISGWNGIYSVLPACASIVSVIVFWIGNPNLTRCVQIPISVSFLIYNFTHNSYMGIVNEVLSLISIVTFIIKEKKQSKSKKI